MLSCSLWLSATTPSGPAFQALPDLPGGSTSSTLSRISSNGLWAIGQSPSTNGPEAVRWSIGANTALGIGDLSGSPFSSFGTDVSNNGLFASGRGTPATGQVRIMRWMSGYTPAQYNLSTLTSTGFAYSEARAISNDGTKLVGQSSSTSGLRAVLWTAASATSAGGTLTNLGAIVLTPSSPAGNLTSYFSEANDISGDGLHIVGTSSYLNQQSVTDPDPTDNYTPPPTFRSSGSVGFIRQTTTLVQLSDLTGGAMAAGAHAISDDKTRVAGFGTSASGTEGVIWNIGTTITVSSVGDLAGGATDCRLLGLNLDGTRAVGKGTDGDGAAAVIWNSALGLRKLTTVLEERGIDVTGWNLTEANSISADGLVIGGNGINPSGVEQAWVITNADSLFLPVPPLPVITSFTASPAVIPPGGTSTLSWTTTGATSVGISPGSASVALSGSTPVTPSVTQIYTLTATDSIGREVTATTTVTINQPPVFPGFATTTDFQSPASLSLPTVLLGTTDPEDDSFTVSAAGPASANGGSAVLLAGSILYTPPNGYSGQDTFPITITDARGSSTNGTVTVTVDYDPAMEASAPVLTVLPDGKAQLDYQGIGGRTYMVQRSTNMAQWSFLATLVAGPTGVVTFIDNNPPAGSAFYRIYTP
jgi:hypothetical protein